MNYLKYSKYTFIMLLIVHLSAMVIEPLVQYSFSWSEILATWDKWQTYNSAMIALASALIAIYFTAKQSEEIRLRKLKAANTVLPEILSHLCEYLKATISIYKKVRPHFENIGTVPNHKDIADKTKDLTVPTYDHSLIILIKECVEHSSEKESAVLRKLLRELQKHSVRLKKKINEIQDPESTYSTTKHTIDDGIVHTIQVYSLISNIFPWAREDELTCTSEISPEALENSAGNLEIIDFEFNEVFKRLGLRNG